MLSLNRVTRYPNVNLWGLLWKSSPMFQNPLSMTDDFGHQLDDEEEIITTSINGKWIYIPGHICRGRNKSSTYIYMYIHFGPQPRTIDDPGSMCLFRFPFSVPRKTYVWRWMSIDPKSGLLSRCGRAIESLKALDRTLEIEARPIHCHHITLDGAVAMCAVGWLEVCWLGEALTFKEKLGGCYYYYYYYYYILLSRSRVIIRHLEQYRT